MQRHFVYISGKAGGQAREQVSVKRVAAYAAYPFEFRLLVAVFVVSRFAESTEQRAQLL